MARIQILKEPGFLYDLSFLFYLKFNFQSHISNLANEDKREDNIKHCEHLLEQLGKDIPDDLFVFFHAIENGRCFFTRYYINPYSNLFTTSFNFKFIKNELKDQDALIRNLIKFYLYNISDQEVDECFNSKTKLFSFIKESKYSRDVKSRLYEFFIDPVPYMHILQSELIDKEFLLSNYYKNNYEKIITSHNHVTFDVMCERMKELDDLTFLNDGEQILYVSYCLLNNFIITSFPQKDGLLSVLGCDYLSILDDIKKHNIKPNLQALGSALCEESRVKILHLLLKRGELTCKDLERIFSFSGSTAYHHITLMTRSGILKTRNEGKTIFYSINKDFIANTINELNNFIN